MNIRNYVDSFLKFTERETPTILTVFGVLGLCETSVLSYKAGLKAKDVLEAKRKDMMDVHPDDKEAKRAVFGETVKEMAPIIVPPLVMGAATGACIVGSNHVSSQRIAAISAAYSLTEAALRDHRAKELELLGEKKARQIKEAIAKDKVQKDPPPSDDRQIIMTGDGDVLCYDSYSGRYFHSNAQKIGSAVNRLTYECRSAMYVSLNEFWDEIGLPRLKMGEDHGWNLDDTVGGELPITITAVLTPDDRPCLCVEYDVHTRFDYRKFH